MEDYNKIIESLGIRFMNAKNLVLQQAVNIKNFNLWYFISSITLHGLAFLLVTFMDIPC